MTLLIHLYNDWLKEVFPQWGKNVHIYGRLLSRSYPHNGISFQDGIINNDQGQKLPSITSIMVKGTRFSDFIVAIQNGTTNTDTYPKWNAFWKFVLRKKSYEGFQEAYNILHKTSSPDIADATDLDIEDEDDRKPAAKETFTERDEYSDEDSAEVIPKKKNRKYKDDASSQHSVAENSSSTASLPDSGELIFQLLQANMIPLFMGQ